MTPLRFKSYGPGRSAPTVIAERITHWYLVDFNGNHGTCIVLDTGKEVTVGDWPEDVERAVRAAQEAR
tara:strand:+ start:15340 stop:15543 length:204 start_codon:yes stop_codon:yes gene_type:complete